MRSTEQMEMTNDVQESDAALQKQAVRDGVIGLLEGMVADWGQEGAAVTPETRLVADLEFASVDVIHLAVAIEEHFHRPRMGFQELLMKDGRYVDDVTVGHIIEFVAGKLGGLQS